MKKIIFAIAISGFALFAAAPVHAADPAELVVQKMSEGDVKAICGGGIPKINEAAMQAIVDLASTGQVEGDFAVLGQRAGALFYGLHSA